MPTEIGVVTDGAPECANNHHQPSDSGVEQTSSGYVVRATVPEDASK